MADSLDVPFHVPFVHRLRFTGDVLGDDRRVLLDVLEPSGSQSARVQIWIDQQVVAAQPDLPAQLTALTEVDPGRIEQAGPIETVPGGEMVKNDPTLIQRMLEAFHGANLDRRSYVLVVGGGAVLDAVGYAAAIAHRGIRLVRLPTTTLAQADSGVGVKNSINSFGKKNWIGTFAVPWAVINDQSLLRSLPDREFVAGFSEAVKVSLLKDATVFDQLCQNAGAIRQRDMAAAWPIIQASVRMHLNHITQGGDPFEALEARPLDFGHWSAHKLEPLSNFQLRHGEAVAIGLAIDTIYSSLVHGLPESDAQRVVSCLRDLGLPLSHPSLDDRSLFDGLEEFRQHLGGRLTVTMLRHVGDPVDVHEIDEGAMAEAIARVQTLAASDAWTDPNGPERS